MAIDSSKHTTEKDVGPLKVRVTPMGVVRRAKLLPKLAGVLSAALSKVDGINLDEDISKLAPALQAICDKLDEQTVELLLRNLFTNVTVSHPETGNTSLENDAKIERAFDGDLMLMFEVMALSLEINFGDFIERGKAALAARFGKRRAALSVAKESDSSSPTS